MNQKSVIGCFIGIYNTFHGTGTAIKFLRQLFYAVVFPRRNPYNIPRSDFWPCFHVAKILQSILYLRGMKLIVESPAPDLKNSLLYYKRLGFQCVEWEDVYLCQTKQLCILLNPDPYSRPCINLFGVQTQKTELSPRWHKNQTA